MITWFVMIVIIAFLDREVKRKIGKSGRAILPSNVHPRWANPWPPRQLFFHLFRTAAR
jgi:hypothetical protein